ncbi:2-oxoglutarate-dependent dioxygenase 19-like isoform X2 [Hevea brasiliensis]|uniref:2-oxoglutarate-dependent dioxygenase 19-like isoform X2 n=1 Tax=Hevea brasiliensis TaxID=3981 RepID=UPI0025D6638F|nr:2-oxoglutarate-dependent dioxygenase 19-like isoform X2 [Hevea brasiliensis]
MAETAPLVATQASPTTPSKRITSIIKLLAESPGLTNIPSTHTFTLNSHDQVVSDTEEPVPVIDYSLLISSSPDQRSKIIHDLRKACQYWGFFMVINHGVPERLMRSMIDACREFFDLPEEEKQEYEGKHVLDPIRCGTSFNTSVEKVFCWRDFLKLFVHPVFHSPSKPAEFSENLLEYSKRVREVARELLKGISESLGLGTNYIDKALNLEQGLQNGVSGLQVQHKGKWVNMNGYPNSFLVNTGDHLEILSNGKYKSVEHRAVVNKKAARISLAMAHGPSLDSVVTPAPELLDREGNAPAYIEMKYGKYLELQQSSKLDGKSCLDQVRI